ncbi:hypothetical protein TUM19329_25980 [Legionella antarctica]|uniref:N-acetyltransferase domain-containing protein n=1 Tax=Legionella antarctica TaxID=2708020 RepID=A0A6F8T7V7_9GAMM|nr:GNAT family N-acetyltransferase [Legionella antarctica]BCA96237.1 hypothetical protein TUM19329_25980 [Legionella antarctica]
MGNTNYTSKKVGDITISVVDGNKFTITTNRLVLYSLNQIEEDSLIENYNHLLRDPKNVALYGYGEPWSREHVEKLIREQTLKWNSGERFCIFSVHDAASKNFIGSLTIKHAKNDFSTVGSGHENAAEIGYILDKKFWGKGFGTEVAIIGKKYIKHLVAEARNSHQDSPQEIVATVHPLNGGSKRILQKTLKNQEPDEFLKFGDLPRLLFFKPLKQINSLFEQPAALELK